MPCSAWTRERSEGRLVGFGPIGELEVRSSDWNSKVNVLLEKSAHRLEKGWSYFPMTWTFAENTQVFVTFSNERPYKPRMTEVQEERGNFGSSGRKFSSLNVVPLPGCSK